MFSDFRNGFPAFGKDQFSRIRIHTGFSSLGNQAQHHLLIVQIANQRFISR